MPAVSGIGGVFLTNLQTAISLLGGHMTFAQCLLMERASGLVFLLLLLLLLLLILWGWNWGSIGIYIFSLLKFCIREIKKPGAGGSCL
jgi:hypothetical protein